MGEREIERIKRAREGEIEKRDKRREEAKRILEQFEQQNRMLEWEERKRKEGKISGRGRGRGRGRMVEGGIHRIGEDIIKVPKKRGPKPKNRPLSDDNLLTDSSNNSKKPGRKRIIESSTEEQTEQEKEE